MAGILPSTNTPSTGGGSSRGDSRYDNAKGHRKGRLLKLFRLYKKRYFFLRLISTMPFLATALFALLVYVLVLSSTSTAPLAPPSAIRFIHERIKRAAASKFNITKPVQDLGVSAASNNSADHLSVAIDSKQETEKSSAATTEGSISVGGGSDTGQVDVVAGSDKQSEVFATESNGSHGWDNADAMEGTEEDTAAGDDPSVATEDEQNQTQAEESKAEADSEASGSSGASEEDKEAQDEETEGSGSGSDPDPESGSGSGSDPQLAAKSETEIEKHLNLPDRDDAASGVKDSASDSSEIHLTAGALRDPHAVEHKKVLARTDLERALSRGDRWQQRRQKVVDAFRHAWDGYKAYAMGFDELHPVSRTGGNNLGGLGATVLDALDTAIIMGQGDVVDQAGGWVRDHLADKISQAGNVNLFETTIRALGGLMSAYYLTGGGGRLVESGWTHKWGPEAGVYLDRARDLGDRLLVAFTQSSSPVPLSDVNLGSRSASRGGNGGLSSTAEAATLQMEFWALSQETGDARYGEAAMAVLKHMHTLPKYDGLVPIFMDPGSGQFSGVNIRLGSRGDSYYEYLLKVWLQQGKSVDYLKTMFDQAMAGVHSRLVRKSHPNELVFVGELPGGLSPDVEPKMDHLVCFLGGTLALSASGGSILVGAGSLDESEATNLQLAKDLTQTCFEMYNVTATGLAPEIVYFVTAEDGRSPAELGTRSDAFYGHDMDIHFHDRHNLLRPETIESLMYLYRTTMDERYREWGWQIFEAFEKYTRVETGGYTSLDDVTRVPPPRRDFMETFFLGETLKYFYLLFSEPSLLPLDEVVFNTEAHVFPIIAPKEKEGRKKKVN